MALMAVVMVLVAPVRERGLKWVVFIKIDRIMTVAPVRERGLKFMSILMLEMLAGRSRKGAWIEIKMQSLFPLGITSLP